MTSISPESCEFAELWKRKSKEKHLSFFYADNDVNQSIRRHKRVELLVAPRYIPFETIASDAKKHFYYKKQHQYQVQVFCSVSYQFPSI